MGYRGCRWYLLKVQIVLQISKWQLKWRLRERMMLLWLQQRQSQNNSQNVYLEKNVAQIFHSFLPKIQTDLLAAHVALNLTNLLKITFDVMSGRLHTFSFFSLDQIQTKKRFLIVWFLPLLQLAALLNPAEMKLRFQLACFFLLGSKMNWSNTPKSVILKHHDFEIECIFMTLISVLKVAAF